MSSIFQRPPPDRPEVFRIFGGPGCGKTTELLRRLTWEIDRGTDIRDIAFQGYTRAACDEALERAGKLVDLDGKRYWFNTIHGTCLRLLYSAGQLRGIKVFSYRDKRDFCAETGLTLPEYDEERVSGDEITDGTAFFSILSYLTNTFGSPSDYVDCDFSEDFGRSDYPELAEKWSLYKRERKLIDFDDMLTLAYSKKLRLPTSVLFVDEFQDLSPLQVAIIRQFSQRKLRVYISGDDDQSLYRFNGAEPELMLKFDSDETTILEKSWRVPDPIFGFTQKFIAQNTVRQPKAIAPKDGSGRVHVFRAPWGFDESDLPRVVQGRTFLLLRTNSLVSKLGWLLADQAVPYRFLDGKKDAAIGWTPKRVEALNSVLSEPRILRRSLLAEKCEKLGVANGSLHFLLRYINLPEPIDPARIDTWIGTVHSAKGREADTVVVFDDVPPRVWRSMMTDVGAEDERRVWYVAMTRARERLVLVTGLLSRHVRGVHPYGLAEYLEDKRYGA